MSCTDSPASFCSCFYSIFSAYQSENSNSITGPIRLPNSDQTEQHHLIYLIVFHCISLQFIWLCSEFSFSLLFFPLSFCGAYQRKLVLTLLLPEGLKHKSLRHSHVEEDQRLTRLEMFPTDSVIRVMGAEYCSSPYVAQPRPPSPYLAVPVRLFE